MRWPTRIEVLMNIVIMGGGISAAVPPNALLPGYTCTPPLWKTLYGCLPPPFRYGNSRNAYKRCNITFYSLLHKNNKSNRTCSLGYAFFRQYSYNCIALISHMPPGQERHSGWCPRPDIYRHAREGKSQRVDCHVPSSATASMGLLL
jgi:hypothetical protein